MALAITRALYSTISIIQQFRTIVVHKKLIVNIYGYDYLKSSVFNVILILIGRQQNVYVYYRLFIK